MILKNKRDQESWLREKTLDSLKTNSFLQEGEIVQVAENSNFYKIIKSITDIPLQNNLYAEVIPTELSGNIETASKLQTPRNISLTGDVTGAVSFDGSQDVSIESTVRDNSHNHDNSTILNIDASKITSGIINIERLPQGALERCVVVADDTARFKLTSSQVQLGDTVKVTATKKMYFIIDTSKLSTEAGYTVYTAGTATEVPWSGVTGKPSTYTPSNHTHTKSQITDFPSSLKNPTVLTIQANGTSLGSYDGSAAKTFNLTASNVGAYTKAETDTKLNGKANTSHGNHVPAVQTASNKVFLRNDNTWQTITPANIGAQAAGSYASASHTHDDRYYTESEINTKLNGKANTSHGNHVPAVQTASNKVFLRNDNTWATITPANIGAQAAGSYASTSHTHDDRYYTESEINTKLNTKFNTSGGTISGNVSISGTLNASKVYNAVWNDYAEFFERGEETEPGDIIALDGNSSEERYIKATVDSKVIIGVHSDSFAHLIGGEQPTNNEDFYEYNIKKFIPVGLAGRVKVKVIGPVKKGDYITISPFNTGVGISINNQCDKYGFCIGRTIGQVLENKDSEEIGLVKMLILK